jgi:hypothetical protein
MSYHSARNIDPLSWGIGVQNVSMPNYLAHKYGADVTGIELTSEAVTSMADHAFHLSHIRFVDLIQERKMDGVRIVATR